MLDPIPSLTSEFPMAFQPAAHRSTPVTMRFEADEPVPPRDGSTLRLVVGSGPSDGYASVPGHGFTGTSALCVDGAAGSAVLRSLDIEVTSTTRVTYHLFPGHHDGDLVCPATFLSLDLRFDDGTLLSDLDPVDQHGNPLTPQGQGESKFLFTRQWNRIDCDLPGTAAGRRIVEVLVRTTAPWGQSAPSTAWLDEIILDTAAEPWGGVDPVDLVDTRRGSNSGFHYSRGNTFPATAVPNGFTFVTPTTASAEDWIYSWAKHNTPSGRPALHGIAFSHEPSPWMGDRNQLVVSPWWGTGTPPADPAERATTFGHDAESARPYRYAVTLDDGLDLVVAPTDHGAAFSVTPPVESGAVGGMESTVGAATDPENRLVLVIGSHVEECRVVLDSPRIVRGWIDGGSPLSVGRSRMYFHGVLDTDAEDLGVVGGGPRALAFPAAGGPVTLRIGTSFLSAAQAAHAFDLELAERPVDDIAAQARAAWAERFAVLDLDAPHPARVTAYSGLYRLNLYPNSGFENVGTATDPVLQYASPVLAPEGPSTDDQTGAAIRPGRIYVNHGFWDTYRTAWPMYGLLYPELAAELADGFVEHYRTAGWIPRWSSPGFADLMTGTSSDVAFADLDAKGIPLPDVRSAYRAGLRNATVLPPTAAVGRKDLRESAFVGFPAPDTHEPVSWAFEACRSDAALAGMAARLAEGVDVSSAERARLETEAEYLRVRSLNYVHGFDAETGFFRSRERDGSFRRPEGGFDPLEWGGDYTEANAWDFAFPAPHDGAGLASVYGGLHGLAAKLDEYCATAEYAALPGTYPAQMHEIVEARDLRSGQFAVSNQPAHHIPFMYAFTPTPARASIPVRDAVRRLFTGSAIGQGYPGDEDNGEMSAWWLFAASGMYPLQVGTTRYVLTAPAFARIVWHLPGGDLEVTASTADGAAPGPLDVYIQHITVNGSAVDRAWIDHADLVGGARVEVLLGQEESSWATGTGPDVYPPSISDGRPVPWRDILAPTSVRVDGSTFGAAGSAAGGRAASGNADGDRTASGSALVDDEARTTVRFEGPERILAWTAPEGPETVEMYTLTGAGDPALAPGSWRIEGSADGSRWQVLDERDGETFEWPWQIRPFAIVAPRACTAYRCVLVPDGEGTSEEVVELAQVEFLARS